MTDKELQVLVEEVSMDFFHRPFQHKARFNARLRITGGRYHLKDHTLDFNPLVFERYGEAELVNVIKHELCHYHLHITGQGYQHKDRAFKELLKATGGSRYAPPLQESKEYCYQCLDCHQKIRRRRRIDIRRYVCGNCQGKLQLISK